MRTWFSSLFFSSLLFSCLTLTALFSYDNSKSQMHTILGDLLWAGSPRALGTTPSMEITKPKWTSKNFNMHAYHKENVYMMWMNSIFFWVIVLIESIFCLFLSTEELHWRKKSVQEEKLIYIENVIVIIY